MDDAGYDKLLNPCLARPDTIVLERLLRDAAATRRTLHAAHSHSSHSSHPNLRDDSDDEAEVEGVEGGHDDDDDDDDDDDTIGLLLRLNDPGDHEFAPTVFTWFNTDPHDPSALNRRLIQPYARWAAGVARRPTDAVFVTHGLIYLLTLPGSAALLFWRFNWAHAAAHAVLALLSAGPFTLMLHNHIHNGGVLARNWARWDRAVPYVLQPLLGHTWDSYYFHHVKHHHVEGNGPCDLSSTLRYQRDNPLHFAQYLLRFLVLVWLELPCYFLRRRQPALAVRTFVHEATSYLTYYVLWCRNPRATAVVFLLPLLAVRVAMMVGNWAQHSFIDHRDPASDLRSSVTLIDVTSNRHCFNDGYHTSHHLNPRRHWRDHPAALIKARTRYARGRALVFADVDYATITWKLLTKNYAYLADHFVPLGTAQARLSRAQVCDMLRTKTRRFTEDELARAFGPQ